LTQLMVVRDMRHLCRMTQVISMELRLKVAFWAVA
jgi:hypothetical protein